MNLYVDAGANWGNTLRLAADLFPGRGAWTTVAFEASPFIQPFLEQYIDWLNGARRDEPELCLPRSGSTVHLDAFARLVGCPNSTVTSQAVMRSCMFHRFDAELRKLAPLPALNSTALVRKRLAALETPRASGAPAAFTHVPAAVGTADGVARIWTSRRQDLRGGATTSGPSGEFSTDPAFRMTRFAVPSVDVVAWLQRVATPDDFVVLKLDVEGVEHALLRRIEQRKAMPLVDAIALECHGPTVREGACALTHAMLRRWTASFGVQVFNESRYKGLDSASRTARLSPSCAAKLHAGVGGVGGVRARVRVAPPAKQQQKQSKPL